MKRKMLIAIALLIVMLLNCILPVVQVSAEENDEETTTDEETIITDVEITLNGRLYKAIKANLQGLDVNVEYNDAQRTLKITVEDIEKVKTLNLSNYEIKDITGIEIFTHLVSLDLSANKLTEASHLELISNFESLEFLDISSNEIADVSMITNLENIKTVNIHNQKFHRVEIIEVDDSEASDQVTYATFKLPQILSLATEDGIVNPEWLPEEKEPNGPYINWRVFNGKEVQVVTAEKVDDHFIGRYGMTTLRIRITEPTNTLYNSDISLFYVSVSSEQRGIVFKDKNLYNAVKKQLTKDQTINPDLYETVDRNLYDKAYDEPMVLVIDISDLINNIPSLRVADKKVVDLTGIEKFVGLEKELNASNNYIENISVISKLRELKDEEAAKLKTRFANQQNLVKEVRNKMEVERNTVKAKDKKLEELDKELDALVEKYATASDTEKPNIEKQIDNKNKEKEKVALEREAAQKRFDAYIPTFITRMKRIYQIFEKQHKITSILTAPLARQTEEEFDDLKRDEAKALLDAEYDRLGNIENNLTKYETQWLINYFGIPLEVTTTVTKKLPSGETQTVEVTEKIENPIKTYFAAVKEAAKDDQIAQLKSKLRELKRIAEIFKMANYCFNERLYNGTSECLAETYLDREIELKEIDGEKHVILSSIKDNLADVLTSLEEAGNTCDGAVNFSDNFEDIYSIGGRVANVSTEEINDNVTIAQLKYLDVSVNLIESIAGIEELPELKGLYLGDNELCDISDVDWSKMVHLLDLDVSFNDLSDIKPLEVIRTLEKLNVARNLLEGPFDFDFSGMPKLKYFDLSENRIDDIQYLRNQIIYVARGAGFDDISGYLESGAFDIRIYRQMLSMEVKLANDPKLTYIDLPNIFRQAEELDYARTSFEVNSILGNATNDGKQVILDTSKLGTFEATVTIGRGTSGGLISSGPTTSEVSPFGIAYGTSCTIYYTVEDPTAEPEPDTNTVDNTVNNTVDNTIDNTVNNTVEDPTSNLQLGYETEEEYIVGVSPNTTINNFKSNLTSEYRVEVKTNGTVMETGKVTTAMIAVIYDNDNKAIGIYEIIVSGDVNGDGVADAVDSGLIKAHRAEVLKLSGAYERAADINGDKTINATDARLLLYHRAEVPGYIL